MKKRLLPILTTLLLLAGLPLAAQRVRAATYTVTNTNDSGAGSLRQAIINANNNPGPDTIGFNIPTWDSGYSSSSGVWTIQLVSILPSLTSGDTIIDGATQTTNQGDTNISGPEVQIDGSLLGANAWIFSVESNANQILSLVITDADYCGVKLISGAAGNIIRDNYIGVWHNGWSPGGNGTGIMIFGGANGNVIAHNVIGHNDLRGIFIGGSGTDDNMIRRNYIGVDYIGTGDAPNGLQGILILNGPSSNTVGGEEGYRNYIGANHEHGVYISNANLNNVTHNYIGLDSTGTGFQDVGNTRSGVAIDGGSVGNWIAYNVISGNDEHGVLIEGSGTDYNYVHGNIIGADAAVTKPIPNGKHGVGVYDGAQYNEIGDSFISSHGNVVVGSGWSGVVVVGAGSDHNLVGYNIIGTDQGGSATDLGNNYYGVHIVDGADNLIELNHIAYNGAQPGRAGVRVEGTTAVRNTISRNSIHDNSGQGIELVDGGNTELWTPTITSADCDHVEGSTGTSWTIEVFSDMSDEGRTYEGAGTSHAILPSFSWSGSMNGPNVTVTATDGQGNTSEFSAPFSVGPCKTPPNAAFTINPTSGDTNTVFQLDASGSSDAQDPTSALEVRWDWEDDGVWNTGWNTAKVVNRQFPVGTHTVRLEVRDTDAMTHATTHQVTVNAPSTNTAPNAAFTVNPASGDTSTVFQFNASGSSDTEDPTSALEVRWDWENDGTWDTGWSTAKTANHTYATPGTYTIRLRVRDTGGLTDSATHQAIVGDHLIFLPLVLR